MKLQEHHREFAIKCFAEYMQRSVVAHAFILTFQHDLPKPPHVLGERTEGDTKTRKHSTWHTQNYLVIQQVRMAFSGC